MFLLREAEKPYSISKLMRLFRWIPPVGQGTVPEKRGGRVRDPKKCPDEIEKKELEVLERKRKTAHPIKRARKKGESTETPKLWWIRSTSETCAFFGVSDETIRNWEKAGAPKVGYGKWDVQALVEWKYRSEESPEARKLKAEADLKEAKASLEQIRLDVTQKRYIEAAQVTKDLSRLFSALKKSLMGLGNKISADLVAIDPDIAVTAGKVVDDTVRDALEKLAAGKELRYK